MNLHRTAYDSVLFLAVKMCFLWLKWLFCPSVSYIVASLCVDDQTKQTDMFTEVAHFNPDNLQGGGGSGLGLWSECLLT